MCLKLGGVNSEGPGGSGYLSATWSSEEDAFPHANVASKGPGPRQGIASSRGWSLCLSSAAAAH